MLPLPPLAVVNRSTCDVPDGKGAARLASRERYWAQRVFRLMKGHQFCGETVLWICPGRRRGRQGTESHDRADGFTSGAGGPLGPEGCSGGTSTCRGDVALHAGVPEAARTAAEASSRDHSSHFDIRDFLAGCLAATAFACPPNGKERPFPTVGTGLAGACFKASKILPMVDSLLLRILD